MTIIEATEFKTRCLDLLDHVFKTGEKIQIAKGGTILAEIGPARQSNSKHSAPGFAKNELEIVGDIVAPLDNSWRPSSE